MPYIAQNRRSALDQTINDLIAVIDTLNEKDQSALAGDLNYTITRLIDSAYPAKRYRHMNEIVGVLECAKMEFYRRIASPYEDQKIYDEGDAYGVQVDPAQY